MRKICELGRFILSKSGADKKEFLSAVYKKGTQAKKHRLDVAQFGRSMVEMLGVLAIIGVLSVGGIAGYSKAMFKHKLNKQTEQIGLILDYMIINQESLKTANFYLLNTLKKLNIISEDMVKENDNMYAYDIFNTRIKLENHHLPSQPAGGLAIGLQIDTSGHSMDICRNLLTMAQQRAEDISRVYVQRTETDASNTAMSTYYGNKITSQNKYLRNLSITQIDNACQVCEDTTECFVFVLIGYTDVK